MTVLAKDEIANNEIPDLRRKSLAFSVTFIRVLAGAYQQWRATGCPGLAAAGAVCSDGEFDAAERGGGAIGRRGGDGAGGFVPGSPPPGSAGGH